MRKREVNALAELPLLLPDFSFPFMLNAHGNIFSLEVILLDFLFLIKKNYISSI